MVTPKRCSVIRASLVLLGILAASAPEVYAQERVGAGDPLADGREAVELPKLLVVPVAGRIEPDMVAGIQRDVRRWLEDEPATHYVVFEIDTTGGDFEAAQDLADFIFRELKKVITIAFIPPEKTALSAGALIAVAAKDIVMGEDAVLGAAEARAGGGDPVDLGDQEKSVVRDFAMYASERGYWDVLTRAMATEASSDIRKVTVLEFRGNDEVEETRFLTESDYRNLKREEKVRTVGEAPIVVREGERLTMTAEKALEYDFTEYLVDNLGELREVMNITIPDENVIDVRTGPLRPSSPAAQSLIDFLNHPIVRGFLLTGGALGLLLELKLLGAMIPGAIGLLCFAIFFIGAAFPVTGSVEGTASVYEILLFIVGAGLVTVELVFPGFAIFAISGCGICAASIVMAMIPADTSEVGLARSIESSLATFLWSFVIGIVIFFSLVKYLPRIGARRRGGIVSDAAIVGVPNADSALEDQARLSDLLGKSGVVVSALRPAGKIELEGGRFLNVVSNGEFIDKGQAVTVQEINGPRIVVTRRRDGDA